jgi:hypothetical protein
VAARAWALDLGRPADNQAADRAEWGVGAFAATGWGIEGHQTVGRMANQAGQRVADPDRVASGWGLAADCRPNNLPDIEEAAHTAIAVAYC